MKKTFVPDTAREGSFVSSPLIPQREQAPGHGRQAVPPLRDDTDAIAGKASGLHTDLGHSLASLRLFPPLVQQLGDEKTEAAPDAAEIRAAALRGTQSSGEQLPHLEAIQRSFGHHDVSQIVAHTDGAAREAALDMGAEAFATGPHVAFCDSPSLHTAAHEAAHVVQQRSGVALAGGIGEAGDPHEQHADAVADRVVQGLPSEALLDAYAPGGGPAGGSAAIQRKLSSKLPTRWYRLSGGSFSRRVNDKIDLYNETVGDRKRVEELADALARLTLLEKKQKQAQEVPRGAIEQEINGLLEMLGNIRAKASQRQQGDKQAAALKVMAEVDEESKLLQKELADLTAWGQLMDMQTRYNQAAEEKKPLEARLLMLTQMEQAAWRILMGREGTIGHAHAVLDDIERERSRVQDESTKESKFEEGKGPKAGMELEWGDVMWIDAGQAMRQQSGRNFFNALMNDPPAAKQIFDGQDFKKVPASYGKRAALLTSPLGTWEGQADSTIDQGPNLEIVTKPMTPEQWMTSDAEEDAANRHPHGATNRQGDGARGGHRKTVKRSYQDLGAEGSSGGPF